MVFVGYGKSRVRDKTTLCPQGISSDLWICLFYPSRAGSELSDLSYRDQL